MIIIIANYDYYYYYDTVNKNNNFEITAIQFDGEINGNFLKYDDIL